jgi:HSP20 family protein
VEDNKERKQQKQEVIIMALVRSDPFRDVDRLFQQLWGNQNGSGAGGRPMAMPMDAYRKDDSFLIRLDLPGVQSDSIDLTVEENVLTIKADRPAPPRSDGIESVIAERPYGAFTRQVFLGTNLDTENIRADYEAGVLTLAIPVAEQAKPRRIEVSTQSDREQLAG